MALSWDKSILPVHSVMFARKNLSRSGGLTISGVEQVVQSSTDFWEAQIGLKIRTIQHRLAYRALMAQSFGRATEWIISACDPFGSGITAVPDFSFDSSFDSSFALGSDAPAVIPSGVGGVTDADADKGDRQLDFEIVEHELVPLPGQYFSIGDRLYVIGTVSDLGTAHHYRVTFAPGLRADALAGSTMEFSNPRCLMRLAQDNIGQMNLDMLRFADITLSFVEVPV
jgi:hypothetical protein